MSDKKRVTILGATGSVGQSTVDLIRRNRDQFEIGALTANSNVEALASLAREFSPQVVAIADSSRYGALCDALAGTGISVLCGQEGIVEASALPVDWTMAAIVGAAGLQPTMTAVQQGKTVAFANKECLVCAGDLMMADIRKYGTTFLPVDSEHNAIFQVFENTQREKIERLVLTGSGGPFRTVNREVMASATRAQALAHPNWSMGAKISIDSATMMNKGLEFIEACYLFDMPAEKIDILVHPQSVIHSMVEYADGSILAQLGSPDMRTPIAYCLGWPDRMDAPVEKLDFVKLSRMDFEAPDYKKFPALRLAREAHAAGMSATVTLNAANEIAVAAFLDDRIRFLDITNIVEDCLNHQEMLPISSVDDVIALDGIVRRLASRKLDEMS
ncbi:1-deoxy-D-xylulose-5-phosphate reductoisomerase [Aestuariispira ectoiniformans]|uniref:1-deoxy-D-xylulose-5-phosphate reductoisomerase n=1 Tax=Aestuariispira ectoiniformans TaxID=2775080 RepID=UPI00223ADADA|nr:1-deoxy-D-xylulose-5-phosphate reductoisomerase [Aestuariispira ectoiniformans]